MVVPKNISRIGRHGKVAAAFAVAVAMMAGCGGGPDPETADRSTIKNSLHTYLEMLKANPAPTADDVLPWVSREDGGRNQARRWLAAHPDAEAHIGHYTISDPYEMDDSEPEAKLSIGGEACPKPHQCMPYPVEAGTIYLRQESGEYLLDWNTALQFLGNKEK